MLCFVVLLHCHHHLSAPFCHSSLLSPYCLSIHLHLPPWSVISLVPLVSIPHSFLSSSSSSHLPSPAIFLPSLPPSPSFSGNCKLDLPLLLISQLVRTHSVSTLLSFFVISDTVIGIPDFIIILIFSEIRRSSGRWHHKPKKTRCKLVYLVHY